jgi:hypothetical protein
MRRTTITLSAVLMLLVFAPASALARHHHRRHHSHARIERFGRDVTNVPTTPSSADNAGTVQSFSNGVLTIMLRDGSTVSGAVTGDTELECVAPEQSQTIHEDGDGGNGDQTGSGDQSGSSDDQAQGADDQSAGEDQSEVPEPNASEAGDQNESDAAEQNENEDAQNNCTTADLIQGAVVREAELRISSTGGIWKKVELES